LTHLHCIDEERKQPMAITKRDGSKYWYIQFQFNGRTYIKSSKTTDKALAEQLEASWRKQLIEQHQLGVKPPLEIPMAFQLYADSKSDLVSFNPLKRSCQRLVKFYAHLTYIHQIQTREIEQWRFKQQADGYSNQTIKHSINNIAGAIRYAKKLGYQVSDFELPTIKLPKGRLRYLSNEEEQRLLAEIDPYRHVEGMPAFNQRNPLVKQQMIDLYHLIIVLLDTGARHGEICQLEWGNINLEKRTIALWRPKVQNESVIYMTDRVVEILNERYRKRTTKYLFTNKQGLARKTLTHVIQRAFRRAGLEGCSAHTLRHTHATRLIQNGLNLYEVKEILGHSDIKTTMRYAHIEQAQVSRKAVDVINIFNNKQFTATILPSK